MNETIRENKFINVLKQVLSKIKTFLTFLYEECLKFPLYLITNPFKGYDEFKREKRAKISVSLIMVFLTIVLQIMSFEYSGFIVNERNINDLNSFAQILYVISPIVIFTVANWSITTLFDGKGTMKEIFMMTSYSLFPLVITGFFGMLISNFITLEEVAVYNLIIGIGVFFTGFMIFFGLINIHEYGLAKMLLTIIATIIALAVILFVLLLTFDLFQKVYGFIYTIYREISLRYI